MTTANYMEKTQGVFRDDRVVIAMAVLGVAAMAWISLISGTANPEVGERITQPSVGSDASVALVAVFPESPASWWLAYQGMKYATSPPVPYAHNPSSYAIAYGSRIGAAA